MYEGHWHGTTARIKFCATDGCIVLPPQVAVIEAIAVCGQPATLRTQWHEFSALGLGVRGTLWNTSDSSNTSSCCAWGSNWLACGTNEAIWRGTVPSFSDIIAGADVAEKKLNIVCDLATDVGKEVLLLGYNSDGIWIRTMQDGTIQDGEVVTLAQSAGTTTTNTFSSLTAIQFNEERDGVCWLYEYNTDTTTKRMIGLYQAYEVRPDYPKYFMAGIRSGSNSDGSGCAQTLIEAIVKLNFTPVNNPTDYLCVPCLPAIKVYAQALSSAENEPDSVRKNQILATGLALAREILDRQAQHFVGNGNEVSITVSGSAFVGGPIPQLL